MGRQLLNADVEFISLVKKGANQEQVTIYKSADFSPEDQSVETKVDVAPAVENPVEVEKTETPEEKEMKGFFQILKEFFGGGKKETEVVKSKDLPSPDYTSFSSMINNQKVNIRRAIYTLEDVMWEVFWDDQIENGKELIQKAVSEFSDYINNILSQSIEVQKEFFEKVEKSDNEEELEVKKEDLMAIIKEALDPVNQSINGLAEKVSKMEKEEAEVKKEEGTEGAHAAEEQKSEGVQKSEELTVDVVKSLLTEALSPISKSVNELSERVQTVEQARGISKSLESTEMKKSEEVWAGVLSFIPGTTN
jgi:hypothetical protein